MLAICYGAGSIHAAPGLNSCSTCQPARTRDRGTTAEYFIHVNPTFPEYGNPEHITSTHSGLSIQSMISSAKVKSRPHDSTNEMARWPSWRSHRLLARLPGTQGIAGMFRAIRRRESPRCSERSGSVRFFHLPVPKSLMFMYMFMSMPMLCLSKSSPDDEVVLDRVIRIPIDDNTKSNHSITEPSR